MPFGLQNAPAIFQRFVNSVLHHRIGLHCSAYLDDIIVYSEDPAEHRDHVRAIILDLLEADCRLRSEPCEFNTTRCDYLRFVVKAGEGIAMDEKKVKAIKEWQQLQTVKDVRALLGLANYYRWLIPHYSDNVSLLTDLTRTKNKVGKGIE